MPSKKNNSGLIHFFEVDVAVEYGVIEAIIINNFKYWIDKNMKNETHFYDGHYWTYNSAKALCELFPYLSKDQLNRKLNVLVEKGVLIKGHYSDNPTDRTTWFAFSDEAKWISRNYENDLANPQIPFSESAKCIYTNNKHTNNNINQSKIDLSGCDAPPTQTPPEEKIDYKKLVDYFNSATQGVFGIIRYPLGDNRKKMLKARFATHGKHSFMEVVEKAMASDFLKGQNNKNWCATFDWLIKPSNYEKVLSGNYDNITKQPSPTSGRDLIGTHFVDRD